MSEQKDIKRKTIDHQMASRTYENDIINNAAYSMDILTKDNIPKRNYSITGPTLNSSSGTLRITIQNGKRIAIYITDSMKLSKKALHYIVNEYPYIEETVKAGENTYLSYFLKYKQNN